MSRTKETFSIVWTRLRTKQIPQHAKKQKANRGLESVSFRGIIIQVRKQRNERKKKLKNKNRMQKLP